MAKPLLWKRGKRVSNPTLRKCPKTLIMQRYLSNMNEDCSNEEINTNEDDFLEPSFSSGISRRILVVRHIPEIRKSPIDVTLSDASMYNPSIAIEQGVIRGAVDTGQANTYLTWVEGKYNTANASSKLLSNTIEVINMDLYRHEEKGLTEIKSEDHTIFYKVNPSCSKNTSL
jgi:hypothetical protein